MRTRKITGLIVLAAYPSASIGAVKVCVETKDQRTVTVKIGGGKSVVSNVSGKCQYINYKEKTLRVSAPNYVAQVISVTDGGEFKVTLERNMTGGSPKPRNAFPGPVITPSAAPDGAPPTTNGPKELPKAAAWDCLPTSPPDITALAQIGSSIFAASYNEILGSTDEGDTWKPLAKFKDRIHQLVSCGSQLAAATEFDKGRVLLSPDGISWNATGSAYNDAEEFTSLGCSGTTLGVGIVGGASISTDNGKNWTRMKPTILARAILVRGQSLEMVGDVDFISSSYCTGAQELSCYFSKDLRNPTVLARLGTVLYSGTYNGVVDMSLNEGRTWTPHRLLADAPVTSVLPSQDRILAAGSWGVFQSSDKGQNWAPLVDNSPKFVTSLFLDDTYLFAGSDSGLCRVPLKAINWPK